MILADTSVWIDFLRYKQTPQVAELSQSVIDGSSSWEI
jgi:predicted nucleic acid-binding protein